MMLYIKKERKMCKQIIIILLIGLLPLLTKSYEEIRELEKGLKQIQSDLKEYGNELDNLRKNKELINSNLIEVQNIFDKTESFYSLQRYKSIAFRSNNDGDEETQQERQAEQIDFRQAVLAMKDYKTGDFPKKYNEYLFSIEKELLFLENKTENIEKIITEQKSFIEDVQVEIGARQKILEEKEREEVEKEEGASIRRRRTIAEIRKGTRRTKHPSIREREERLRKMREQAQKQKISGFSEEEMVESKPIGLPAGGDSPFPPGFNPAEELKKLRPTE